MEVYIYPILRIWLGSFGTNNIGIVKD